MNIVYIITKKMCSVCESILFTSHFNNFFVSKFECNVILPRKKTFEALARDVDTKEMDNQGNKTF